MKQPPKGDDASSLELPMTTLFGRCNLCQQPWLIFEQCMWPHDFQDFPVLVGSQCVSISVWFNSQDHWTALAECVVVHLKLFFKKLWAWMHITDFCGSLMQHNSASNCHSNKAWNEGERSPMIVFTLLSWTPHPTLPTFPAAHGAQTKANQPKLSNGERQHAFSCPLGFTIMGVIAKISSSATHLGCMGACCWLVNLKAFSVGWDNQLCFWWQCKCQQLRWRSACAFALR